MNVLGNLLTELRNEVKSSGRDSFLRVEPLSIINFRLMGELIQPFVAEDVREEKQTEPTLVRETEPKAKIVQTYLIDY